MVFGTLKEFLVWFKRDKTKGPFALIFVEDDIEVAATIAHAQTKGFAQVIVFGDADQVKSSIAQNNTIVVNAEFLTQTDVTKIINKTIACKPAAWFHYCFNAEFLFFPFSNSRSVPEFIQFCEEERRYSILSFVIDLYSNNLENHPNGVDMASAYFDTLGYYGTGRQLPNGDYLDRQQDFHGGLRSRFEEFVPKNKRKIDRVSLFKSKPNLQLRDDHTFNDEEYNTYGCKWHNSPTSTIASFRAAKALRRNPASAFKINNFMWHGSQQFKWDAEQLMKTGLMEPGQWF